MLARYAAKGIPAEVNDPGDVILLRALAARHPDPALSAEITRFEVRWQQDGGRGFAAICQDGTAVEWSFYTALLAAPVVSSPAPAAQASSPPGPEPVSSSMTYDQGPLAGLLVELVAHKPPPMYRDHTGSRITPVRAQAILQGKARIPAPGCYALVPGGYLWRQAPCQGIGGMSAQVTISVRQAA